MTGDLRDAAWRERAVASVRLSLELHVATSPAFGRAVADEGGCALGEGLILRTLFGDVWSRDWAERLFPEIEVSDEWLAALDRLRDDHVRWMESHAG